jgi:hypothetical protein
MTTKRKPIARLGRAQIFAAALDAFRRMQQLEQQCTCAPDRLGWRLWCAGGCSTCDQWWEHHAILHRELRLRPWQFPAVEHPDAQCPYPAGSYAAGRWRPDEEAQARYRALENALAERGGGDAAA